MVEVPCYLFAGAHHPILNWHPLFVVEALKPIELSLPIINVPPYSSDVFSVQRHHRREPKIWPDHICGWVTQITQPFDVDEILWGDLFSQGPLAN